MDNPNKADSKKNNSEQQTVETETDMSSSSNELRQINKTINIDGQRPVDPSNIQIKETINIDGQRPIVKDANHSDKTINIDGQRPIDLEVEEILDIDGQRPIAKSNFPVQDTLEIDGSRPIVSNNTVDSQIPTDYVD